MDVDVEEICFGICFLILAFVFFDFCVFSLCKQWTVDILSS